MPDPITVFEITGPDAGVEHVLQRHHDQMRTQSPEESCHVMTGTELRASGARIFAASDGQTVFGIGALKPIGPKQIELKSMAHNFRSARKRCGGHDSGPSYDGLQKYGRAGNPLGNGLG